MFVQENGDGLLDGTADSSIQLEVKEKNTAQLEVEAENTAQRVSARSQCKTLAFFCLQALASVTMSVASMQLGVVMLNGKYPQYDVLSGKIGSQIAAVNGLALFVEYTALAFIGAKCCISQAQKDRVQELQAQLEANKASIEAGEQSELTVIELPLIKESCAYALGTTALKTVLFAGTVATTCYMLDEMEHIGHSTAALLSGVAVLGAVIGCCFGCVAGFAASAQPENGSAAGHGRQGMSYRLFYERDFGADSSFVGLGDQSVASAGRTDSSAP